MAGDQCIKWSDALSPAIERGRNTPGHGYGPRTEGEHCEWLEKMGDPVVF